jgi:hypothetical protein
MSKKFTPFGLDYGVLGAAEESHLLFDAFRADTRLSRRATIPA